MCACEYVWTHTIAPDRMETIVHVDWKTGMMTMASHFASPMFISVICRMMHATTNRPNGQNCQMAFTVAVVVVVGVVGGGGGSGGSVVFVVDVDDFSIPWSVHGARTSARRQGKQLK